MQVERSEETIPRRAPLRRPQVHRKEDGGQPSAMSYHHSRHPPGPGGGQQQQRPRYQPPELHSVVRGSVTRIEPYGCFVRIGDGPVSGLVHVSQLHAGRVESPDDVVNLDDVVYAKVVEVTREENEDPETGRTRVRHRVRLSMKYADQDTGEDLDPDHSRAENDASRSGGGGGGGGFRDEAADGTGGANSSLGQALS
ncbi:hypothetical protein THAOC_10915, partial [Thalassiosira oceanica]